MLLNKTGLASVGVSACMVLIASCDFLGDRTCSTEIRSNLCVTINGSSVIDSSYTLSALNRGLNDTLLPGERCFSKRGSTIVTLSLGDSVLAQTQVNIATVDVCHGANTTVNFEIPE